MIKYILVTNDPQVAKYAEASGVGRVFVDLEVIGKQERQGHLDTLISNHSIEDVYRVKAKLTRADLLVRLNPMHVNTVLEVEEAILAGADLLMLPMFRTVDEILEFSRLVDGRVKIVPLVETYDAAVVMSDIVTVTGVDEIYIGLNDLHLDMGLKFMFEPLVSGFVEQLADIIRTSGKPFGFGGIARYGEGIIPGELVLGEHLRLGSSSVMLSRTFHRKSEGFAEFKLKVDLEMELKKLSDAEEQLKTRSAAQVLADQQRLSDVVTQYLAQGQ
jgi:hypothetical protein